jgi:hypothetical protein
MTVNETLPVDEIQTPTKGKPAPKPGKQDHLRVLSNGAVYDMRLKRIVSGKAITTKITSDNAIAMQSRKVELKREALARAANAVAAQGGGVDGRLMDGPLAFVEAIGEAMTMKALTVNDPKAVDAARFIFTETGIAERQVQHEAGGDTDPLRAIGALFMEYVRGRGAIQADDVIDIRNDNEQDEE